MTPQEMLRLPMDPNDSRTLTVGGYLQALLQVWKNNWQYDLYFPLIKAGVVTGGVIETDDEGYDEIVSSGNAEEVIETLIKALFIDQIGGIGDHHG
jgi:hypothetical protein